MSMRRKGNARMERREDKVRRKLAEIMPVLRLYVRQRDPLNPKQIAKITGKSVRWVQLKIKAML